MGLRPTRFRTEVRQDRHAKGQIENGMKVQIVNVTPKSLRASDYIEGTDRKTNRSLDSQRRLEAKKARQHLIEAARWAARQRCIKKNCGTVCLCGPCHARAALEHYGERYGR